jgi:hypothetical protein
LTTRALGCVKKGKSDADFPNDAIGCQYWPNL